MIISFEDRIDDYSHVVGIKHLISLMVVYEGIYFSSLFL